MPDPKNWQEWFELADGHLAGAKALLPDALQDLPRLAAWAAECYLKGLLCKKVPKYKGKDDRHCLRRLLQKAICCYPNMESTRSQVETLHEVVYAAPEEPEGETSCSVSCQVGYNPAVRLDFDDAEERIAAAEVVATAAKQCVDN